eukprot:jgi/Galph1/3205/GphlegSOOS_G1852.1
MASQRSLLFLPQTTLPYILHYSKFSCNYSCCRGKHFSLLGFIRGTTARQLLPTRFSDRSMLQSKIRYILSCQYSSSNDDNFGVPPSKPSGGQGGTENNSGASSSNTGTSETSQDPAEELPLGIGDAAKRYNLKINLYQLCASTDRGQTSRPEQRSEVEDLAAQLEALNPNPNPLDGTKANGIWELIYSSVPFYKTSPFLLAAATPFLRVGQWRQTISVVYGELVNEVDVEAFPGLMGTVVQFARVTPVGGERLEIAIEKTSLKGRSIADKLDLGGIHVDIPLGDILRRVQGSTSEIFLDTFYLDDELRISRTRGGRLLIFSRVK